MDCADPQIAPNITTAVKPFNVIVGCNTFEGVAADYGSAIILFTFALSW